MMGALGGTCGESNFFKHFAMSFNFLGLKKLIATCYAGSSIANKQLSLFDDESEENKTTKVPHKLTLYHKNGDNYPHLASCKVAFVAFRCINRRSRNISRAIRFST